jgi:hypothetical protein
MRLFGGPKLWLVVLCGLLMLALPASSGAGTYTSNTPIAMPAAGGDSATPYPSSINVSGVAGQVLSVRASLNSINDTNASEIDALLVAPNGQSVVLMSNVCGNLAGVTLTFADGAPALAPPCATGTYRPTDGPPAAGNFNGPAPMAPYGTALLPLGSGANGTWKLWVQNNSSTLAVGTISGGWTLQLDEAVHVDLPPPVLGPQLCDGKFATILVTDNHNVSGTPGADVIYGTDINESIRGLVGADSICGRGAKDKLIGGDGRDRIFGGLGNDILTGGSNGDLLDGGPGKDKCVREARRPHSRVHDTLVSCEIVVTT